MAYTPPPGNAADFTTTGVAYTAPAGSVADLTIDTGNFFPSGFSTAQFGSPSAAFLQILQASGAAPSTTFGLANVYPGYVPGLGIVTQFGAPSGPQLFTASSIGEVTRFSMAYYKFDQTRAATGSKFSSFGTPFGSRRVRSGGVTCRPVSFTATIFGSPSSAWRQIVASSGFASSAFGTPGYLRGGARVASGFEGTGFGAPSGVSRFGVRYVTGFSPSSFGTPAAGVRNRADSLGVAAQFGTPLLNRNTTC